mgnify:CR=1 FL=1
MKLNHSFIFLATCRFLFADPLDGYWQQKVDYEMQITLHDSIKQLTGKTVIKYTNNSLDSIDRLFMHLYPNAFQTGSVKYREYVGNAGRGSRAKYFKGKMKGFTSKIDVHDLSIALPKEGHSWIHKTPILKSYKIEDTILEAQLTTKLAPGNTVRIDLNWTHHIGEMVERAGYYKGQYNMAQWYPKMAVYDEKGWHSDVFHAEGEFYGEFGNFVVKFDIPKSFIIAASGVVIDGDPGWEEVKVDTSIEYDVWLDIHNSAKDSSFEELRRSVTFFAENVHDFAWVASKDFLYEGGISGDGETNVHVLYNKSRGNDWTKVVLERSIRAIDWLEEKFGNYPYPQITTTDRLKNGGMEYPMLVMNGRDSESLIVHEYGHIYFYGILANNELDEAWLDEGLTTNQTTEYMMDRYGPHGFDTGLYENYDKFPKKFFPLNNDLHYDQWRAIRFMSSGYDENISRSSYLFNNGISYSNNAYNKPALMLFELKYILGDSIYYGAMKHYFEKWKLKHVNEYRFIQAIEEFTGNDLDWFFNPWLHTSRQLDYGLAFFKKEKNNDGLWDVELGIKNFGSRFMPMLIETEYRDGSKDRRWWENHLWRYQDTLSYVVDREPMVITLDPDVQTVDLDLRNNTNKIKRKFLFNWPGIWYEPRDEIVYWWIPTFYFYEKDSDFMPGLNFKRTYGPYEKTTLAINYGIESKKIHWNFYSSLQSVHHFPRTLFKIWGFDKPGVMEYGLEIEKKWNRVYGRTPTHVFSGGLYYQPKYDSIRAKPLGYETNGELAVGYLDWKMSRGPINLNFNGASTLGSFSSWDFNRITFISKMKIQKSLGQNNSVFLYQRIISGMLWTNDDWTSNAAGAPSNEMYNVEGNSSNEMLRKNYLIDQFYGVDYLFSNYHLPGDGNIRGFVNRQLPGADAIISSSTEISFKKDLSNLIGADLNLEFSSFADGGIFWNKSLHPWYPPRYIDRILADAGVGFRMATKFLEQDLFIRFDFPFYLYDGNVSKINFNNWVFSFQKSI